MPPENFADLVNVIIGLISLLIPVILAVVFLFLVWKIFDSWIINVDDEKKRTEGKQYAVVSVVVMVIISLVWGIVYLLRSSIFGI